MNLKDKVISELENRTQSLKDEIEKNAQIIQGLQSENKNKANVIEGLENKLKESHTK